VIRELIFAAPGLVTELTNLRTPRTVAGKRNQPHGIGDLALRCVPREITLSDLRWSTPSAQVTAVMIVCAAEIGEVGDRADQAILSLPAGRLSSGLLGVRRSDCVPTGG